VDKCRIGILLGGVLFLVISCSDSQSDFQTKKIQEKEATLTVTNFTGASVSALIYIGGDTYEKTIESYESVSFSLMVDSYKPCLVTYEGRFAEFGTSDVFRVLPEEEHRVFLRPNVGWMRIINNTATTLEYVKFGDTYCFYNSVGKRVESADIINGESKWCRIDRSGSGYITFRSAGKGYRVVNSVGGYLGIESIQIISSVTDLQEIN
jgi:hypothetical protein